MKKEQTPTNETLPTTKPLPASKKIFVAGKIHDIKVAMREISLSNTIVAGNGK